MATTRPLPPMWLMGLGFMPLGASGSLALITVPQLLAANNVPVPLQSLVTTAALMPGFLGFIFGPLLDWRFSRRAYAIGFSVVGAVAMLGALFCLGNLVLLSALLFVSSLAIGLGVSAVGGWFGNITGADDKGSLGAWFTVANFGYGGIVSTLAIPALRDLPYAVGAVLACLSMLLAVPLYLWVPCPPADGRLASESFRAFSLDVLALLRRPTVLWTLLLFLLPSASFALTNLLSGTGKEFHTSEWFVALIGGLGIAAAAVGGSLLMPPLSKWIAPRPLYLLVGGLGAIFTLTLILAPHNPTTFTLAMLGENAFQAAAFSVANFIILRTIGNDNPLAATQFSLLNSAGMLPLTYMQFIDGQAYGVSHISGSYLADALISGTACVLLAVVLWLFRKRVPVI